MPASRRRAGFLAHLVFIAALTVGVSIATPWDAGLVAQVPSSPRENAVRAVMAVADEYVTESLIRNPVQATALGLPDARHGEMIDNSLAARRAWEQKEDRWLAELQKVDPALLFGTPAWTVHGVLREQLESARDGRVCRDELWPVNHMTGWQTQLPAVLARQPVGTAVLRDLALSRFGKIPLYLDTELQNVREGMRRGYLAPKLTVELTIAQLDRLLSAAPESSPLFAPAQRDKTPEFVDRWRTLVVEQLRPAVERYRNFLRDEYLAAAREAIAATANPDGAACYRAKVRVFTALDIDPEQLFAQQMAKLEEAEASMRQLAERSYKGRDIRQVLKELYSQPESRFETRDEAIAAAEAALKRAEAHLPNLFARLPPARIIVEPVPAFLEATAPNSYQPAPRDGSRPAVFRLNVRQAMGPGARIWLERGAFHEGAPGHHLQLSLVDEAAVHAVVRFPQNAFVAFVEGWAAYAEQLAFEHGMYSSDAAGLVALNRLSWRFASNVAEIGVHVKGWSRQQAIDFRTEYDAMEPEFEAEQTDRRIAWLGQGHAYAVGASEILGLREEAKQALGPKFDLREFHSQVLEDGFITLPMLREKISRWIKNTR
jgi:uncharacterized protein (DUF885 family)